MSLQKRQLLPTRMLYAVPNNSTVQKLVGPILARRLIRARRARLLGLSRSKSQWMNWPYKLNMDPVELRLKNYAERDEDKNLPWSTKSLRECYRRGAERFGWAQAPG